jgi:hypothetical protein
LLLLHGAEQCTQPLAKAEEKHAASALQHNGKMEDVTKSLLRRTPQLTMFADVSGVRARNDAGGRPLVSGSLCRYADRLCHSIRSFSMAVLRRLGAGGSLRKHRTRRPASRARYSHSEWLFGVMTANDLAGSSHRLSGPARRPTIVGRYGSGLSPIAVRHAIRAPESPSSGLVREEFCGQPPTLGRPCWDLMQRRPK